MEKIINCQKDNCKYYQGDNCWFNDETIEVDEDNNCISHNKSFDEVCFRNVGIIELQGSKQ